MKIEYDVNKSLKNEQARGISFELARQFDLETAMIKIDVRKCYGELRFNALGLIGERLYHMTFTVRTDVIRVISLRKANNREIRDYAYHH